MHSKENYSLLQMKAAKRKTIFHSNNSADKRNFLIKFESNEKKIYSIIL
jgi:hypothetical protein